MISRKMEHEMKTEKKYLQLKAQLETLNKHNSNLRFKTKHYFKW